MLGTICTESSFSPPQSYSLIEIYRQLNAIEDVQFFHEFACVRIVERENLRERLLRMQFKMM